MKCPMCDGKGIRCEESDNGIGYISCECYHCNGTGEIEQTNEEWFCQLPTEEKAKVFANATYSTAETPLTILWGGKEAEQKKWELWLKQQHTVKE